MYDIPLCKRPIVNGLAWIKQKADSFPDDVHVCTKCHLDLVHAKPTSWLYLRQKSRLL